MAVFSKSFSAAMSSAVSFPIVQHTLQLAPLAGLEWEGWKVLYQIADSVVNRAEHRVELSTLLPARALDSQD